MKPLVKQCDFCAAVLWDGPKCKACLHDNTKKHLVGKVRAFANKPPYERTTNCEKAENTGRKCRPPSRW